VSGPEEDFRAVIERLRAGDFSVLEPLFRESDGPSRIQVWYEAGRFNEVPDALLEAFTCACFLGSKRLVEAGLAGGLPPAGGTATGLSALHWAASRGQHEVLDLLLRRRPDLELLNQYGGTVLGQAVWSAIHEPRPGQERCIEALVLAGAKVASVPYPSGHERTDAVLTEAIGRASGRRDA
jgi:hypothetical protein